MVSAGNRSEYFPVFYAEPRIGNKAAFGFDLASNVERYEALQRSLSTGELVATAPITLVQETESQQGFLCFLPVYENNLVSEMPVGREDELRGFVLGVFRIGDLVDSALTFLQTQDIDLELYDVTKSISPELLYKEESAKLGGRNTGATDRSRAANQAESEISIGGRKWSLTTTAGRQFGQTRTTIAPWVFFSLGLILTTLLILIIYRTLSRNFEISKLVSIRTALLRESESQLRDSEQTLRAIVENASDVIFTLSLDGVSTYVSPEAQSLMGYEASELVGKTCALIVHREDILLPICKAALQEMLQLKRTKFIVEYRAVRKDGLIRWHNTTGSAIIGDDGKVNSVVCIARDITDRRLREDELTLIASHDSLTGLQNRGSFDNRFDKEWRRAVRDGSVLSVVMIDIDHFKNFNDAYGHQAGDECLKRVASALRIPMKRPSDFVARYGGEEFVAILPGTDVEGATYVCEQMSAEIARLNIEHSHSSTDSRVAVSIGFASVQPIRALSPEALLACADKALYRAKAAGRNTIRCGEMSTMKTQAASTKEL